VVFLSALGVAMGLACSGEMPTQWDDAAQAEERRDEPVGDVTGGSSFNTVLPPEGHEGTRRVFTQEKPGYAEADYQRDGLTLCTVSVSDTHDNPVAREKFAAATERVGGNPVVDVGANSTSALVADRYQVRVSSTTLGPAERRAWLQAADLSALIRLD
jgi:hypothetical protein